MGYYLSNKIVNLYNRDKGICFLCGEFVELGEATIEHEIPKRDGGTNARENIHLAHAICNNSRGHGDIELFRANWLGHTRKAVMTSKREVSPYEFQRILKTHREEIIESGTDNKIRIIPNRWTCNFCGSRQRTQDTVITEKGMIRVIRHCFMCSNDNIVTTKRIKEPENA